MGKPARLLLVEDNDTNLMIFRDILVAAGHDVITAGTAEDACGLARTQSPDLILMDIQLPGMSGLDAVRCLKQDPHTRSIPVVAISAHVLSNHREQALQAGCCGFIT